MSQSIRSIVIKDISEVGKDRWNYGVKNTKEGTFFHTFEWNQFLKDFGKLSRWYTSNHIVVETNELQAILPLFLCRENVLLSPPTGDYGGPCIILDRQIRPVIKLLVETMLKISRKYHAQIQLKSVPKKYAQAICDLGYFKKQNSMTTFLLDVKNNSMDVLLKRWSRLTRRSINRARNRNVKVEIAEREEAMEIYYTLYKETMQRLKASLRPYSFFKLLWRHFQNKDICQILLAKHKNQYIAGLIYFIYKGIMHIYGNVSIKEQNRDLHANDLLFYETINQGLQQNCQVIDFGETHFCENSGLYQFKKRWGGVPKPLIHLQKTSFKIKVISRLKQVTGRI